MIPYTLTTAGWDATQPRRAECGHILCTGRDDCLHTIRPTEET